MKVPAKKLILSLLILSILACHGCIFPATLILVKATTGSIDPSFIKVGVTTKEQVVLRCGYPFAAVSDDERVLTYSWDTVKYTRGDVALFESDAKSYPTYLKIYFDENNIVKNYMLE